MNYKSSCWTQRLSFLAAAWTNPSVSHAACVIFGSVGYCFSLTWLLAAGVGGSHSASFHASLICLPCFFTVTCARLSLFSSYPLKCWLLRIQTSHQQLARWIPRIVQTHEEKRVSGVYCSWVQVGLIIWNASFSPLNWERGFCLHLHWKLLKTHYRC